MFLSLGSKRGCNNPIHSSPPEDGAVRTSRISSDSSSEENAETLTKRESQRFSFIENVAPVMLRKSVAESIDQNKKRSSLNTPLFRDPVALTNSTPSSGMRSDANRGPKLFERNGSEKPRQQPIASRTERQGRYPPHSNYRHRTGAKDEEVSCDSDGFASDGSFSCGDYEEQGRSKKGDIPSSTINVREMASFLEKTNSFIRFLEPGKDGKAKECNEVKSIPYKSRQLDDMGWNETASTSYAGYDGHRSFKRADDVGAACVCEA